MPVEIWIFRFTAPDSRVIVTVQSAHVAKLADACASGAHGATLGGSNPLVSTAQFSSQISDSNSIGIETILPQQNPGFVAARSQPSRNAMTSPIIS